MHIFKKYIHTFAFLQAPHALNNEFIQKNEKNARIVSYIYLKKPIKTDNYSLLCDNKKI